MSATISESITVDSSDPDLVRIQHVSQRASGVDMGGALVFSRTALDRVMSSLAEQAASPMRPDDDFVIGDDDISIFGGGHDSSPSVHFTVRRNKEKPGGGLYNLIMSPECVQDLLKQLGAVKR